jgi:hypothetical protein
MSLSELHSTLMAATGVQTDELALVVSPNKAMRMLDCGRSRLYEMIAAGELETYLDGRHRKITVASIYARVCRKLQEAKAG